MPGANIWVRDSVLVCGMLQSRMIAEAKNHSLAVSVTRFWVRVNVSQVNFHDLRGTSGAT